MLWGLSATFWDMTRFVNQSLLSLFQAPSGYTCWKHYSLKFWSEFYIKGTLFLSSKTFCIVNMIFYWLFAIKKEEVLEFMKFLVFLQRLNIKGTYF